MVTKGALGGGNVSLPRLSKHEFKELGKVIELAGLALVRIPELYQQMNLNAHLTLRQLAFTMADGKDTRQQILNLKENLFFDFITLIINTAEYNPPLLMHLKTIQKGFGLN